MAQGRRETSCARGVTGRGGSARPATAHTPRAHPPPPRTTGPQKSGAVDMAAPATPVGASARPESGCRPGVSRARDGRKPTARVSSWRVPKITFPNFSLPFHLRRCWRRSLETPSTSTDGGQNAQSTSTSSSDDALGKPPLPARSARARCPRFQSDRFETHRRPLSHSSSLPVEGGAAGAPEEAARPGDRDVHAHVPGSAGSVRVDRRRARRGLPRQGLRREPHRILYPVAVPCACWEVVRVGAARRGPEAVGREAVDCEHGMGSFVAGVPSRSASATHREAPRVCCVTSGVSDVTLRRASKHLSVRASDSYDGIV